MSEQEINDAVAEQMASALKALVNAETESMKKMLRSIMVDVEHNRKALTEEWMDGRHIITGAGFHIDPEAHYKQHQSIQRFLDIYESTTSSLIKLILGVAVLGVLAMAALGQIFHKG